MIPTPSALIMRLTVVEEIHIAVNLMINWVAPGGEA